MEQEFKNENGQGINDQPGSQKLDPANTLNFGNILHQSNPAPAAVLKPNTSAKNEELNKPVTQETKKLDSLITNQQNIDQFYQDNLDKKWTLWSRMINNGMFNLCAARAGNNRKLFNKQRSILNK